ncbi:MULTISPECIES: tyrosine-protein phosphatase [Actinomycetes]|uniref:Protein tyrosine phosphatase n=1 Tax=Corynebacterium doosanense CAU 212 = DSM 45436 TaxID=558173 RepID=A0A097ID26_9CORY|nr:MULTISPECIES: tyrosine-protein phosphatase [Actinomycetes]AIT60030.1 protein tyrosine phosphatase [Corynebacterium doosanense CAU 212 = DSM 45436]MCE7481943.1 tyrosine-protein phosphatase [Microbacterium profundi]
MSAADILSPDRRHIVEGVYNLRDTGGYRAATGTSRWGTLFRSDALHRLDDAGRARLAELRIAHIVDLRGTQESLSAQNLVEGLDARVHHLPVFDDAAPGAQAIGAIALGPLYDHMVDERGAQLAAAVRVIADVGADEAVLVHCTAGKDRTGLVIAFALRAAGVELDDVVADYAQTADNLRGEWADAMLHTVTSRGVELTPDVVDLVTASPAPIMAALLQRIEREYGSMAGYLLAQGLTSDELDRLTAALID